MTPLIPNAAIPVRAGTVSGSRVKAAGRARPPSGASRTRSGTTRTDDLGPVGGLAAAGLAVGESPDLSIDRLTSLVRVIQAAGESLEDRVRLLLDRLVEDCRFAGAGLLRLSPGSERPKLTSDRGWSETEGEKILRWGSGVLRAHQPGVTLFLSPGRERLILFLEDEGRLLGGLVLTHPFLEELVHRDRSGLELLATVLSLSLEQEALRQAARTNRDERLRQLEFLVASGQAIAVCRETEQVYSSILSLIQQLLSARASWIALYQPEDDTLQVEAYRGLGKESLSSIRLSSGEGVAWHAFRQRRAWLVPDVRKERLFAYPEVAQRLGLQVMLAVPLLARSEAIGVLGVFLPYMPADEREQTALLEIAEVVAGQAAAAIQNARLFHELEQSYARERRIAETLQQALLADVAENLPGVEVGHDYRAALNESVVGGDFYDVFRLPGGQVGLLIGDVSGKGLTAAVQTARVKFSARAYALEDPSPHRVLERVHTALSRQEMHGGFVSLFLGIYDPATGLLRYANGGHEPPLLHRASGQTEWLPRTATVVGLDLPLRFQAEYSEVAVHPGDHLVLYTDGMTEVRRQRRFLERRGVLEYWKRVCHLPPAQAAKALIDWVRQYAQGQLKDDVAVLVVRFRETTEI